MIDGRSTTVEWQRHTGRIAVWGIGACEQHGPRLPLDTDSLLAETFARGLAQSLDAALLPTLGIGTSLEHTGFRGTISLRPETLMQVVREVAEAVAEQGFTRLVLVNGHGGNHSLLPVARDINRRDGRLKIVLAAVADFADREAWHAIAPDGAELHAGAFETSLLLALDPSRVRDSGTACAPAAGTYTPIVPRDLTMFGVGAHVADGVAGNPRYASREVGERLVASIHANLLAFVRECLCRFDRQPRYCAGGGLALRPLTTDDVPAGLRLGALAGWNQTEDDWRLLLSCGAGGRFAAVHNGRVVGTACGLAYAPDLAWIGMVLVDPEYRRLGIATRLMEAALESLAGCGAVGLDATAAGRAVYARMGFTELCAVSRMVARRLPRLAVPEGVRAMTEDDLAGVCGLDAAGFGVDRRVLLRALRAGQPGLAWVRAAGGGVAGACVGRAGACYHQVGPVYGRSAADAIAVLGAALSGLRGKDVAVDVPAGQSGLLAWLDEAGFVEERRFVRMIRGSSVAPRHPVWYAASAGPEWG